MVNDNDFRVGDANPFIDECFSCRISTRHRPPVIAKILHGRRPDLRSLRFIHSFVRCPEPSPTFNFKRSREFKSKSRIYLLLYPLVLTTIVLQCARQLSFETTHDIVVHMG